MARGFVIGLFLSAALTLVVCKLLDRRTASAAPAPESAAKPAGTPATTGAAAADEIARLKSENETTKKKIADSKAAQARAAEAAAAAKSAKSGNPWGKIAKGLLAFLKQLKEDPKAGMAGSQDLMIEMMALLGKIAKERGVALNEGLLTPEGLPALLAAALEDADPPLTDSERQALEKFVADMTAGFEALQKDKEGRTTLEQRLEMMRNGLGTSEAFMAELGPEHAEVATQLKAMGMGMMGSLGAASGFASGTPEEIRDSFSKQWAKALKFDESQAAAFGPIVEEYMRTVDASTAAFQKDMLAGIKGGESKMILARLDAQIAAQKKIESSFTLTKAQKKALDGWATTYVYWGGAKATPPDPQDK
ncbi:MAG: hypothetical protein FD180_1535 [Planctomycetota bacterium]|nr:MAG: hypothetical protein FD180_1535 [Planctomycetota bacterium]